MTGSDCVIKITLHMKSRDWDQDRVSTLFPKVTVAWTGVVAEDMEKSRQIRMHFRGREQDSVAVQMWGGRGKTVINNQGKH